MDSPNKLWDHKKSKKSTFAPAKNCCNYISVSWPPPRRHPCHGYHHHKGDALDVLAKTPGLYHVPELRYTWFGMVWCPHLNPRSLSSSIAEIAIHLLLAGAKRAALYVGWSQEGWHGMAPNTKLSITHLFLELQSPDFAWKFVWTVQTNTRNTRNTRNITNIRN